MALRRNPSNPAYTNSKIEDINRILVEKLGASRLWNDLSICEPGKILQVGSSSNSDTANTSSDSEGPQWAEPLKKFSFQSQGSDRFAEDQPRKSLRWRIERSGQLKVANKGLVKRKDSQSLSTEESLTNSRENLLTEISKDAM